jgi:peptidoglycan hydrolase-like protein with peptidoglycan-binding domain
VSAWGIADLGTSKPDAPQAPSKPSKPTTNTSNLGDKMPTLKRGSKGTDVRRLQGLLTANGYKTTIDGIFGPQTEKKVRAFQSKRAKPSDGIVGRVTWSALLGV